jgi:hypothetical protein
MLGGQLQRLLFICALPDPYTFSGNPKCTHKKEYGMNTRTAQNIAVDLGWDAFVLSNCYGLGVVQDAGVTAASN